VIDCSHVRMLWDLQRRESHELDAAELAALERHVGQCPSCLVWTQQERRADEAVGAAVRAVPVPEQLKGRIQARLRGERRPSRLPWAVAAAASLLITAGLGTYLWLGALPELSIADFDGESLGYVVALDAADGVEKCAETVEAWFAQGGARISAPRSLRYEYLDFYEFKAVKGRQVPWLQFLHPGGGKADVYVIAADQFNVEELRQKANSPSLGARGHTIEVEDAGSYVYVIVYTGGSLEPFRVYQRTY
jgi:hypothetical protein